MRSLFTEEKEGMGKRRDEEKREEKEEARKSRDEMRSLLSEDMNKMMETLACKIHNDIKTELKGYCSNLLEKNKKEIEEIREETKKNKADIKSNKKVLRR